jgi:putative ABC transport system permease protein
VRIVEGAYFRTMGIPLLRGRLFEASDTGDHSRVVVVSQELVDREFPGEDPLGHEILVSWDSPLPDRIIGVVGNIRHQSLESRLYPMIYWPYSRFANNFMTLTVRTEQPIDAIAPALGRIVRELDPGVPVSAVRPMREMLDQTIATRQLVMGLLSVFAGLALVLAALGIYAVTIAAVAERRAELAIRMALGASPPAVALLVVGQTLASAAIGAGLGLAGAVLLGRIMEGLLFQVRPADPWALGGTVLALVVVAALASLVPGRAAAKVDPMEALKAE